MITDPDNTIYNNSFCVRGGAMYNTREVCVIDFRNNKYLCHSALNSMTTTGLRIVMNVTDMNKLMEQNQYDQ